MAQEDELSIKSGIELNRVLAEKFKTLEEAGNHLIKLIGTYEVVIWRLLALYIAVRHFLGI